MPTISRENAKERLVTRLIRTAKRRKNRSVTADDAQKILTDIGYKGYRAFVGTVLKGNANFTRTGYTKSEIPSNKHRAIGTWRLRASV